MVRATRCGGLDFVKCKDLDPSYLLLKALALTTTILQLLPVIASRGPPSR